PLSLYVLWGLAFGDAEAYTGNVYEWAKIGNGTIAVGFLIDKLTALMMVVVTSGSLAVHVHTIGYMHDDPGSRRFCRYTSLLVVTSVSLAVHVYTIGYMHDDPGYQRFFSYISLFTFSMLMLVMSNNLMQLFFGWEAVGLVSYLLIGFWFKRPSAVFANLKAFL